MNGGWKIKRRTIVLDINILLDKNLSVFLYGLKPNQLDAFSTPSWRPITTAGYAPEPNFARILN